MIETRLELTEPLVAPVPVGTKAGTAVFLVNGVERGRVEAVCGEAVPLPLLTAEEVRAMAAAQN